MYKQSKMRAIMALALLLNVSISIPQQTAAAAGMYHPQESERSPGAMAVDAIAVRPLGIVATALGTGLFVVSLPFSALGGNTGEAWDTLVVTPARFTFVRPLGEYDAYH
jgi:hypothetical protein